MDRGNGPWCIPKVEYYWGRKRRKALTPVATWMGFWKRDAERQKTHTPESTSWRVVPSMSLVRACLAVGSTSCPLLWPDSVFWVIPPHEGSGDGRFPFGGEQKAGKLREKGSRVPVGCQLSAPENNQSCEGTHAGAGATTRTLMNLFLHDIFHYPSMDTGSVFRDTRMCWKHMGVVFPDHGECAGRP